MDTKIYPCIHTSKIGTEMGNGRLHYHFCGIVKDPMKHKIFMHNWSARWGNYHIDTWDQKETFINYLNKEMLLKSLLGDIPGQDIPKVMTNDNYSKTMDCLLAKFTWDRKVKEVHPVTMNVQDFYLKKYYNEI